MKRFVIFISVLFLIIENSFGQHSTMAFSGAISGNVTWNTYDTIYITGNVTIGASASLTIAPNTSGSDIGVYVVFTGVFGISVTSGLLNVNGTSTDSIYFTADRPAPNRTYGNHIFGESGETFRNLEFWGAVNPLTSNVNYAVVEYGTGSLHTNYRGGGIIINGRWITISNSTIRNCNITASPIGEGAGIYAVTNGGILTFRSLKIYNNTTTNNGGGLFVGGGNPVTISECEIYNNGGSQGDGIFFNSTSQTTISNSLIYNHSGGEGIFTANTAYTPYILNSTVVNNYIGISSGGSFAPVVTNCIVWGNSTQFSGTNTATYCGVQGGYSGTGNFVLDANNTAVSGPNFTSVGSNWSINFISPLRDIGTSTGTPTTDILGNSRIFNYDIGAYEVQYSRWTGGTNLWATQTNWDKSVDPASGTGDVIIPSGMPNYPTGSSSQNFTIATGKIMTLYPGARATFGTLTNNGALNLYSSSSEIFSLMMETYSGTGTANVEMYLTGAGGPDFNWHYVAPPGSSNKSVLTSINAFNLLRFDDSQIPDGIGHTDYEGWEWHDGYKTGDPDGGPYTGTPFSTLDIGRGYNFYHTNTSATANFTNLSSLQSTLGPLALQYSGGGKVVPANYGFNLLGNSLTCGIDWDLVTEVGGDPNNAVYYTANNRIGMYVRGAGPGTGINGATKDIPPLQGFFVKAIATGSSLDFSGAREHTSQARYKKGNTSSEAMVKLELNNSGNQDETLIWFNEQATNSFDGNYDASKLFSSQAGYDQIYTLFGSEKFGINGIPFPEASVTFPVAVKFLNPGSNFKIFASSLQGLDGYNVILTDKLNSNFTVDLKNNSQYLFSSESGTFTDRFTLTISKSVTDIENPTTVKNPFMIFSAGSSINIRTLDDNWDGKSGSVRVWDFMGKTVAYLNNVEFWKTSLIQIESPVAKGLYIVEIKSGNMRYVSKVVIRQ